MRNAKRSKEKAIECSFAFTAAIASETQEKYLYMVCVCCIYICVNSRFGPKFMIMRVALLNGGRVMTLSL